ncbi:MAG: TadE family protein [Acidobacteriota bacterium]
MRRSSVCARLLVDDESGSSLIELAFILGIFGPLLLFGTVDIATAVYASIEIESAAHAGAMYGMTSSTYASNTSGIQTAAQAEAADFGTNLTVTSTVYYACSSNIAGTQYTTSAAATTACTGSGNHSLAFVKVTTSAPVTPALRLPSLPATYTLTSVSIMEVEE